MVMETEGLGRGDWEALVLGFSVHRVMQKARSKSRKVFLIVVVFLG
jgi:hypothetical protein